MNVLIIISCICFLFICMRIFVVPIKLMVKLGINSILGIIFILIVNFIGIYFNFHIGINWITILIVRILGVPGEIFIILVKNFI